jgi:hypothetical protein
LINNSHIQGYRNHNKKTKFYKWGFPKSTVQKPLIFLLFVGSLIGVGIILSFYGAQLTTQNLIVIEENLMPASSIEVIAELDPAISETGVFGILLENFEEGKISVSVFDPLGTLILSKIVEKESTEERFEIVSKGSYNLIIENSGSMGTQIVAGMGHMPDTGTLSVGITGFYILIVGLIGIVGVGIYSFRNRKKQRLS